MRVQQNGFIGKGAVTRSDDMSSKTHADLTPAGCPVLHVSTMAGIPSHGQPSPL